MTLDQLLKDKREDILEIAAKQGAKNVRVFGLVARGDAGRDSDIDLQRAEEAKRRAEERLKERISTVDASRAEAALQRSIARLKVGQRRRRRRDGPATM